MRKRFLG